MVRFSERQLQFSNVLLMRNIAGDVQTVRLTDNLAPLFISRPGHVYRGQNTLVFKSIFRHVSGLLLSMNIFADNGVFRDTVHISRITCEIFQVYV